MNTTTQSIAMKYADFNAEQLVHNIKNGYCSEDTKKMYADALDLLASIFDGHIRNIKSYSDESKTDKERNRTRSVIKTHKLELISLITQL